MASSLPCRDRQDPSEVVFSWQGGEPTLLGLEFLRDVIANEQTYATPHQCAENDLQTNGTLLDDSSRAFQKQHGFLIGLRINGPKLGRATCLRPYAEFVNTFLLSIVRVAPIRRSFFWSCHFYQLQVSPGTSNI